MRNSKIAPAETRGLFRKRAGLALLAAAVMTVTACPENVITVVVTPEPARLLSVNIGGVEANRIPAPISVEEWNDPSFNLADLPAGIYTGLIVIGDAGSFTVNATVSEGARPEYGVTDTEGEIPSFQPGNTVELAVGSFLYIRVTSGDGVVINIYRFLMIDEPSAPPEPVRLLSVDLDGRTPNRMPAPVSAEAWNAPEFNPAGLPARYTGSIAIGGAGSFTVNATVTEGAALEYGVTETAAAMPLFQSGNTVNLAAGNFLYIRVTSGEGGSVYRFSVSGILSGDATLYSVSVGGAYAFELGSGFPTLAAAVAGTGGRILLQNDERMEMFETIATATHPGAVVSLGHGRGTGVPSFYTHNYTPLDFNDGDFLYVRVIAENGDILFHKIQVHLRQVSFVVYGTPEIGDGIVDPIWTNLPTQPLNINRVYRGDSQPDFIAGPNTSGVARVLWDSAGLYVYVRVTDPGVTSASGNAHERDSVELFVNEVVDSILPPGNWGYGSMYRVGANGDRSGAPDAAADAFGISDAWTTPNGYVVIFHVPWRHGTPNPGDAIGLDLRVNASTGSVRNGVLAWSNLAHSNYENMANLGLGILLAEGEGPITEIVVDNPVFSVANGAVRNQDGSITMPGGNAIVGFNFAERVPRWNSFASVTFTLTFTQGTGTGNMGIQIKNTYMGFDPDIATGASVDRFPGQSGTSFSFTRPTSVFGSGAVTFQMATWGGRSQNWVLNVSGVRFHD